MSAKSRLAAAERRIFLTEDAKALQAEADKLGVIVKPYIPARQRDIPPYPSDWKPRLRFTKDKYGITLAFGEGRKERRKRFAEGLFKEWERP